MMEIIFDIIINKVNVFNRIHFRFFTFFSSFAMKFVNEMTHLMSQCPKLSIPRKWQIARKLIGQFLRGHFVKIHYQY